MFQTVMVFKKCLLTAEVTSQSPIKWTVVEAYRLGKHDKIIPALRDFTIRGFLKGLKFSHLRNSENIDKADANLTKPQCISVTYYPTKQGLRLSANSAE